MFEEIIIKVARSLDKYSIPYMIIGGQAVLLYGTPRLTRDIDITLGINTNCLQEIIKVVNECDLTILTQNYEEFVNKTMVLPVKDKGSGIRVDFIFSFTTYEQEAIRRANLINILEETVKFASVEDIIIHKIFAGRPRDIEDVEYIILKNPGIDIKYIERWLGEFDASSETQEFLQAFRKIWREKRTKA